jgi:hypothetical protein
VLRQSRVAEFQADHDIVEEGGGFVGFHLILKGEATVSRASRMVGKLGPGDLSGRTRSLTACRVPDGHDRSPVRILSLPASRFQPLLYAHPSMARNILLGLCTMIRAGAPPTS